MIKYLYILQNDFLFSVWILEISRSKSITAVSVLTCFSDSSFNKLYSKYENFLLMKQIPLRHPKIPVFIFVEIHILVSLKLLSSKDRRHVL